MINFSPQSPSEKCIKCNYPPCNCSKCTLLRSEDKPDQQVNNPCRKVTCEDKYDRNESDESNNLELDPEASTKHESEEKSEQDIIEQSNENIQEAEPKIDKEELSKENLEEAELQQDKEEQLNENLGEPKILQGDTKQQSKESLKEVNFSEIAITSSEKVVGKLEQFGIKKVFRVSSLTLPSFNFKPDNLQSVLFDMVGIVAFFSMITAMFWVTIAQYTWHFIKIILSSGKKAQLITSVLFLLLCASITYHAIQGRNHLREQQNTQIPNDPPEHPTVQQPPKYNEKCCEHKRRSHHGLKTSTSKSQNSNDHILAPKDSNLCILCAKKFHTNSGSIISDDEALEMFKRYKLYSVPTEMKTPPSIVYVVEILTGFFNGVTNSIANTFYEIQTNSD